MHPFRIILTVVVLITASLTPVAAQTFTWTGSADSLWSNASNWSGGSGYPNAAGADVVFENNTVSQAIVFTENITVNTFTWNVKQSRGIDRNDFDLDITSTTTFATDTRFSPSKSNGQVDFQDEVTINAGATVSLYNVTQSSGGITMGDGSKLTLKAPSSKTNIVLNDLTLGDQCQLICNHQRDLTVNDFTVGDWCVLEFARSRTTTINGTVNWSQSDCSTFSIFRSVRAGSQTDLLFTAGPATGDFNVFEDISITTSGGGNTFTANSHTDLGNNSNISGSVASPQTCEFDGNGNTTGNWSDAAEWDCGCAPRSNDDITIGSGNTVDIDISTVICDDLVFGSSTSRITSADNTFLLEIHGNLTTTSTDNFVGFTGDTEFRNDVTGTTETLECSGCDTVKFYGGVEFEFTNNDWQLLDHLVVTDPNDRSRADLTVDRGTLDANNFDIWVENDFRINSNGTFTPGTGALRLTDEDESILSIAGSGTLYDLVIDKAATSDSVEVTTNITVTHTLDLSNTGIIIVANESADTLILADEATVTGASDNSHVKAGVKKVGNDDFTFPVGDGNNYRPVGISDMAANSTTTDAIFGIYHNSNPFDNGMTWTSWENTLHTVNTREYWDLDDINGSPTPKIVISWDAPTISGTVSAVADMRVAHWTGSLFEDLGNGSTTGDVNNGTVTSSLNTTSFSPFTSASSSSNNTLPVELLDFAAVKVSEAVRLDWTTVSQINVDYFEVERSRNMEQVETVGMTSGAGTTHETLDYELFDLQPMQGMAYYRLKTVNLDGSVEYSAFEAVRFEGATEPVTVFPNPTATGSTVRLAGITSMESCQLISMQGQVTALNTSKQTNQAWVELPEQLKPGVYQIAINTGYELLHIPVVVQ